MRIIADSDSGFESTNTLTITYVPSPTATSMTAAGISLPTSGSDPLTCSAGPQGVVTLFGSGFMAAPDNQLFVLFPDGQLIEVTSTSDTQVEVPFPILEPGSVVSQVYIGNDRNSFVLADLTNSEATTLWSCADNSLISSCSSETWCSGRYFHLIKQLLLI